MSTARYLVFHFGMTLFFASPALSQTVQDDPDSIDRQLTLEPSPRDKSGYHLFNPTPQELRRPISADRPDLTESPYTVDAGAFQLETSFFEYEFDDTRGGTDQEWAVGATILKFGLTNNSDFQLFWTPYATVDPASGSSDHGVGNFGLRLKLNLYGNDTGGSFAIGFLPFIEFPTGDDSVARDSVSGGFAVPVSVELGGGWGLGTQVLFEWIETNDGDVDTFFSHSLVLSHTIVGDLAGYIEYFAEVGVNNGDDYSPLLSAGLSYQINSDAIFDVGLLVGLDEGDTSDLAIFSGITLRF